MSVAFILNPGYNTINNVHHTFWDQDGDAIKNSSLNQALEVSTSVKAPVHVVGDTHTISSTAGGIITDAPQFEIPIVIASQVNTDTILPNLSTTGISVQADLVLDDTTITGVSELTCGTLHYTTLDPAIVPGDASAWSTFPATEDVNFDLNNLSNVGVINCYGVASVAQGASLSVSNQNLEPLHKTIISISTQGDGDTVPLVSSDITLNSLVTGTQDNYWIEEYGALVIVNENDTVISGNRVALTRVNSDKAFVRNEHGAISFNSDFNTNSPLDYFGTAGQVVASQGDALPPQWVDAPAPGDPSTWSEYPATQAVDLVSQSLTSSTDLIKLNKDTTISKPINALFTVSSPDSTSANGGTVIYATSGSDATSYSQIAMGCNSGKVDSKSASGFLYTAGAGVIQTADSRELILQTAGGIPEYTSNIRFAYVGSKKAYTINKDGALNFDADWNGTDPIIEGSFGTSGQIIQSNGSVAAPSWVSLPVSSQYVYYVSKDGTVGASGDVSHPLSTIQAAITLGQAAYPRQVVILIAPGVYTETLSITLPNITLSGYSISQQQNLMTQIVGSVGVSCSASQDLFYSQVCFQNLQISGLLYDNSSVVHTLNVEGCRISSDGAVFAQLSTADNRTRLTRCTILQASTTASTDPILKFSSGLITLALLDVTARNNAPVLQFDGSAKLQACGLCTFESNTTSTTAAPIVYIAPTSAAGYTYAFGYNSFSYPSLVPRSFSSGKNCGIVCEAGTGHPTLFITYNSFNLLLCDATCFVVQDVKKADAAAYTDIRFFSNSSTYLATGIDSTHKTTLAAVA
jgi:hypothetical protein